MNPQYCFGLQSLYICIVLLFTSLPKDLQALCNIIGDFIYYFACLHDTDKANHILVANRSANH